MVYEIVPTGDLKTWLKKKVTVMDYVFIGFDESQDANQLHQQAAVFALEVLAKREDAWFETKPKTNYKKREDYFQIINQPEKATGTRIDLKRFLGGFSSEQQIVLKSGVIPDGTTDVEFGKIGYAGAFFSPPYGTGLTLEEASKAFAKINELAFDGLQETLEIFEWSNDWSTYFDAGHEWWGSSLWTVRHPTKNMIVAIAASTTD